MLRAKNTTSWKRNYSSAVSGIDAKTNCWSCSSRGKSAMKASWLRFVMLYSNPIMIVHFLRSSYKLPEIAQAAMRWNLIIPITGHSNTVGLRIVNPQLS